MLDLGFAGRERLSSEEHLYFLLLGLFVIVVAVLERVSYALVVTLGSALFSAYGKPQRALHGYAAISLVQVSVLSVVDTFLGVVKSVADAVVVYGRSVIYVLLFLMLCAFGYTVLEYMQPIFAGFEYIYNSAVGPFVREILLDPLKYLFEKYMHPVVSLYNAFVYVPSAIVKRAVLPYVGQAMSTILVILSAVVDALRLFVLALVRYFFTIKYCTDYASAVVAGTQSQMSVKHIYTSVSPSGSGVDGVKGPLNSACMEDIRAYRTLDLQSPMIRLRAIHDPVVRIADDFCGVGGIVAKMVMSPLLDNQLAYGVHNLVNALLVLVVQVPIVTYDRCRMYRSVSPAIVCVPDFEPVFDLLYDGALNIGRVVDNFFDATLLALEELFLYDEGESIKCDTYGEKISSYSVINRALFGNNMTVNVRHGSSLMSVTDGVSVQFHGFGRTVSSVVCDGCWPFTVDPRLGIAAIQYDQSTVLGDHSEMTTSLFGCRCVDGELGMNIECTVATYNQDIDNTRVIPIVFALPTARRYLQCARSKISIQSVRWPATRLTSPGWTDRPYVEGMPRACEGAECLDIDAVIYVMPMCIGGLIEACTSTFIYAGCFPYCMGLHVRGSGVDPIVLHSADDWADHVQLNRLNCVSKGVMDAFLNSSAVGVAVTDMFSGEAVVSGASTMKFVEKGVMPLTIAYSGLSALGGAVSSAGPIDSCVFDASVVTYAQKGFVASYEATSSIRLSKQPFAFAGDVALTSETVGNKHYVHATRIFGNEYGQYTTIRSATVEAFSPREMLFTREAPIWKVGEKVSVPYSWETVPYNSVPATATSDSVFYVENPHMDMYDAFFRYCNDPSKLGSLQFSEKNSYAAIRVWRLRGVYCGSIEACALTIESGMYIDINPNNMFSGKLNSDQCDVEFAVKVVHMEYVDDYNIMISVLHARPSNLDATIMEPLDRGLARYETLFLNPVTMQLQSGDMFPDPLTNLRLLKQESDSFLCPAMRRTPNLGSIASNLFVSVLEAARLVLRVLLVVPTFADRDTYEYLKQGLKRNIAGHSLMELGNGADLFNNERMFSSIYRTSSLFWRSISMTVKYVMIASGDGHVRMLMQPFSDVMNAAALYGDAVIVPVRSDVAAAMNSVPFGAVMEGPAKVGSEVNGVTSPIAFMRSIGVHPVAMFQFLYGIFTGITSDLVFQRFSGLWITVRKNMGLYDSLVVSRQRSACAGLSLAFGVGSAAGEFIHFQCLSLVHAQSGVIRGVVAVTADLPSIVCMCETARSKNLFTYIRDVCLPAAPDDFKAYMIAFLASSKRDDNVLNDLCDRMLSSLEYTFLTLMNPAFDAQFASVNRLSSAFSEFFGGDACDDYADDQYSMILIPEPVDYFRMCMFTPMCKLRCNYTVSEFERVRDALVSGPVQVEMKKIVQSRFFYVDSENLAAASVPFKILSMFEPYRCSDECHSAGTVARCMYATGWTGPTVLSVVPYCMPQDIGISMYVSREILHWSVDLDIVSLFGQRAVYGLQEVGAVVTDIDDDIRDRYSLSRILDVQIVSEERILILYESDLLLVTKLKSRTDVVIKNVLACENIPDCKQFLRVLYVTGSGGTPGYFLVKFDMRGVIASRVWYMSESNVRGGKLHTHDTLFTLAEQKTIHCVGSNSYSMCDQLLFIPQYARSGEMNIADLSIDASSKLPVLSNLLTKNYVFSGTFTNIGTEYLVLANNLLSTPFGDTRLDKDTWMLLVARDTTKVQFWLESMFINIGDGAAYSAPSQPTTVSISIRRDCDINSCSGCMSLHLQRLCYQAQQCAIRKCLGSPVHISRSFCNFGLIVTSQVELIVTSGHAVWLMLSETVSQVIILPLRRRDVVELRVTWPEDAFYEAMCESKDIVASFVSLFVSVIYTATALVSNEIPFSNAFFAATSIDSRLNVDLTMILSGFVSMIYQFSLLPQYVMIAVKNIFICDSRSLTTFAEGLLGSSTLVIGSNKERLLGGPSGQCLPNGAGASLQSGEKTLGANAQNQVASLFDQVVSLASETILNKMLHPVDAVFTYGLGVVSGIQDFMQSVDRAHCTLPDFEMRSVSQCSCGDHAASIPASRADLASSVYWCTGTLYMAGMDGQYKFIFNPYSFETLRGIMNHGRLDNFLDCVASGERPRYECENIQPRMKFLQDQGVSTIAVFTRCRTNYNMRQWDEGAYAFYDEELRSKYNIQIPRGKQTLLDGTLYMQHEKNIRACFLSQRNQARVNQECLEEFLPNIAEKVENYFQYTMVDRSKMPLDSADVDACNVFSFVGDLEVKPAVFAHCSEKASATDKIMPQYDDTGAVVENRVCEIPHMLWSGNSKNRVGVANMHSSTEYDRDHRLQYAGKLHNDARKSMQHFFDKYFIPTGEGDEFTMDAVEKMNFQLFSAEGDALHQMFDCMFLGPFARMDMWSRGSSGTLNSPVYYRDAEEGKTRFFDLPCSSGKSSGVTGGTGSYDKLQGDYDTPFTCGSDARRSIIKYYVRSIVTGSGSNKETSVVKKAIYDSLKALRSAWQSDDYGCKCDNEVGYKVSCCKYINVNFDTVRDVSSPETASYIPDRLRLNYDYVGSDILAKALTDGISKFVTKEIFAGTLHADVFTRHSTSSKNGSQYKWDGDIASLDRDGLFRSTVPLRSYRSSHPDSTPESSEHGEPFQSGETLWHMCTGLISQIVFTLPLTESSKTEPKQRPLAAGDSALFASLRSSDILRTQKDEHLERIVEQIVKDSFRSSPLFWHYAVRHVPSDSLMCEDYTNFPVDSSVPSYRMPLAEASVSGRTYTNVVMTGDTVGVSAMGSRAPGSRGRGCFCGWFHATLPGMCQIPSSVCGDVILQFSQKLSNREEDMSGDEKILVVDICSVDQVGVYNMSQYDHLVDSVMSGDGYFVEWSLDWHCPALHDMDSTWGLFTDNTELDWLKSDSTAQFSATSFLNMLNISTRGRSGLRVGSVRSFLDQRTNIKKVRTPVEAKTSRLFSSQRICERSVRDLFLKSQDHFKSAAYSMIEDLFPVAQGISESVPVAYCLRFSIEYARLQAMIAIKHNLDDVSNFDESIALQSVVVSLWRTKCSLQVDAVSKCQTLGVYDMIPPSGKDYGGSTGVPALECPYVLENQHPGKTYQTPGCIVYIGGAFYDPCLCEKCSVEGVAVSTAYLVSTPSCKLKFDARELLNKNVSVGEWPNPDLQRNKDHLGAAMYELIKEFNAWRGSVDRPHLLNGVRFYEAVLEQGGRLSVGSVGNTVNGGGAWGVVEGVLSDDHSAAAAYCDMIADWWPETWEFPVGYHVTVPCSSDETSYRVFDASYVVFRDTSKAGYKPYVYYSSTSFRNKTIAENYLGGAGECTKDNVDMPLILANIMSMCTRESRTIHSDTEDVAMPFKPRDVHEFGPESCSPDPFTTPWSVDYSSYHSASIGLILGLEGFSESAQTYPDNSDRLLYVGPNNAIPDSAHDDGYDPWYGCVHSPIFQCRTDSDCVARLFPNSLPYGSLQCLSGVCSFRTQNNIVFECYQHSECAQKNMMCAGDGRCSKAFLHVVNHVNESIDVQIYADSCGDETTESHDPWGASAWESVPDFLPRHGLCAFRNWNEYYENVIQICRSVNGHRECQLDTQRWKYSRDNKFFTEGYTLRDSANAFEEGILNMEPHACDRDYMHAMNKICPIPTSNAYLKTKESQYENFNGKYTTLLYTHQRGVGGEITTPVAEMLDATSTQSVNVRAMLGIKNEDNSLQRCVNVRQCVLQDGFTIHGTEVPDRLVKNGRKYDTTDVFTCGSARYLENGQCKIDVAVLPFYVVFCLGHNLGLLQGECQGIINPGLINTACGYLNNSQTQKEIVTQQANMLATDAINPWSPQGTLRDYVDRQRCVAKIWLLFPNASGIYHFSTHGIYEYPFSWWVHCTVLSGKKAKEDENVRCEAWDKRFDLNAYDVGAGLSVRSWLQSVRGVYTYQTIQESKPRIRYEANQTWQEALLSLRNIVGDDLQVSCINGREYRWDDYMKNRDYVRNVVDMSTMRGSTLNPFNNDMCANVKECTVDGPLEHVYTENDAIGTLSALFELYDNMDDIDLDTKMTTSLLNVFRTADPVDVDATIVTDSLGDNGICQVLQAPEDPESVTTIDPINRSQSQLSPSMQYICAYYHIPDDDPNKPDRIMSGQSMARPLLVFRNSGQDIWTRNMCEAVSGADTDTGQSCGLARASLSDVCSEPWTSYYKDCMLMNKDDELFSTSNPPGAICHQTASSCLQTVSGYVMKEATSVSVPHGVELRMFKYIGTDTEIKRRISEVATSLPYDDPYYQTVKIPAWVFCPLPDTERNYRERAPLQKSRLGLLLDNMQKEFYENKYVTYLDITLQYAEIYYQELQTLEEKVWGRDLKDFYDELQFLYDYKILRRRGIASIWRSMEGTIVETNSDSRSYNHDIIIRKRMSNTYTIVKKENYEDYEKRYAAATELAYAIVHLSDMIPYSSSRLQSLDEFVCAPSRIMQEFLLRHEFEWSWARGLSEMIRQKSGENNLKGALIVEVHEYETDEIIIFFVTYTLPPLASYVDGTGLVTQLCRRPGQFTGADLYATDLAVVAGIIAIFKKGEYAISDRALKFIGPEFHFMNFASKWESINRVTVNGNYYYAYEIPYSVISKNEKTIFKTEDQFPFGSSDGSSMKISGGAEAFKEFNFQKNVWQSISMQLKEDFTCSPPCEGGKLHAMVTHGLYKCFRCKMIPRYFCVGPSQCGFRFPFSVRAFADFDGSQRQCGNYCWVTSDDVTQDIFPFLTALVNERVQVSPDSGVRIIAWLLRSRIRHERDTDLESTLLYGIPPDVAKFFEEDRAWEFPSYMGGTVLGDYKDQLPEEGCVTADLGPTGKSIQYTECHHNDQLLHLKEFVDNVLKKKRFPVLNTLEAIFWETSRNVILRGFIPAWAAVDRSHDPPFLTNVLNTTKQCQVNAAYRQDSVCYVDKNSQINTFNPWVGGAMDIENTCDTVLGVTGLETSSATDPYQARTASAEDPPWGQSNFYDTGVNEEYRKLNERAFINTLQSQCGSLDRKQSSGFSVGPRISNNLCAMFPSRGGVCLHRQGMLGGWNGLPATDLYRKDLVFNDVQTEMFAGLYNSENVLVSGDVHRRNDKVYGRLQILDTDIGGHRIGIRVSNSDGGLMHIYSIGLGVAPDIFTDANVLQRVEGAGYEDDLHWLRSIVGKDIDTEFDILQEFSNMTLAHVEEKAKEFDTARDGEAARKLEQRAASMIYPQATNKSVEYISEHRWICPLLRRSFYSNSLPGFQPLAPNTLRSAVMFRDKHVRGLHPTMRSTQGILPRLMKYKTMNGFCICMEQYQEDCLVATSNNLACGLEDTVQSLFDKVWRNATDLSASRSRPRCARQLDWPFIRRNTKMRDGEIHMPNNQNLYDGSEAECAILDRLQTFQYRYVVNENGLRKSKHTTLTSPDGDCHFGKAHTVRSREKLLEVYQTHGKCQMIERTETETVVECVSSKNPLERTTHVIQRENQGRSVEQQLQVRKKFRKRCRSCDKPPEFKRRHDDTPHPQNASSFGVPVRFSAARMLLRNLQSTLCADGGALCKNSAETTEAIFNTSSGSFANAEAFMESLFSDNTKIFHENLKPVKTKSTKDMITEDTMPDDSKLWTGSQWIICGDPDQKECKGNMKKEQWMNITSRAEICSRAITEHAGITKTISNLNLCDLHRDLNQLCVLVTENMKTVFEANCHAAGMCLKNAFFYQPSAYSSNNKQFVRSTVREFYNRYEPDVCPDTEVIQALIEQNNILVEKCPAQTLESLKETIFDLRTITRTLVTLAYHAMMLAFSLFKILISTGASVMRDITQKWENFANTALKLLEQIAELAYNAIFVKSPVGQFLRKLIEEICKAINIIYIFVHREALCALANIWKWALNLSLEPAKFLRGLGMGNLENDLRKRIDSADKDLKCMRDLPDDYEYRKCKLADQPPPDESGNGALPMPSRCWLSADAQIGYPGAPICSSASTCRVMEWTEDSESRTPKASTDLIPCASCPTRVPEGFTTFGCDTLTKQCSCMVERPVKQPCASNYECRLPDLTCMQTDGMLMQQYGYAPCSECKQPICVVDGEDNRGYCTCSTESVRTAECTEVGSSAFPPANAVCMSQLNSRKKLSSQYSVAFDELVYIPCMYTTGQGQFCYEVDMGLSGAKMYTVVSSSAFNLRRLLMFHNHTEFIYNDDNLLSWDNVSEPCRSLVLYERQKRSMGAEIDPLNAHASRACIARRMALRMTIMRYGINESIVPDTTFVSWSDFIDTVTAASHPSVVFHEIITKHPPALFFFLTRFECIRPLANLVEKNIVSWSMSAVELYKQYIHGTLFGDTVTKANIQIILQRAATVNSTHNLSSHYEVYLNGTWAMLFDTSHSKAMAPRTPTAARTRAQTTQGTTKEQNHNRRILSFTEKVKEKNKAMLKEVSGFALSSLRNACAVIYNIFEEMTKSMELVSLVFDKDKVLSNGLRYIPPHERAGGKRHNLAHNFKELQKIFKCFHTTPTTTTSPRIETQGTYQKDFSDRLIETVSSWPVVSQVKAATKRFLDPVGEDGDNSCSVVEGARSLFFCNFENIITCKEHNRDVIIWGLMMGLLYMIISYAVSVMAPGVSSMFNLGLFLTYFPLLLWLTTGYAATCLPMVPACAIDDVVYYVDLLLPHQTKLATNLERYTGCLNASNDEYNPSCVLECSDDRLGFKTWDDTVIWGACSVWKCSDVANSLHNAATTTNAVGFLSEILKTLGEKATRVDGRMTASAVPREAYTTCFWLTIVRTIPYIIGATLLSTGVAIIVPASIIILIKSSVTVFLQTLILIHTPDS